MDQKFGRDGRKCWHRLRGVIEGMSRMTCQKVWFEPGTYQVISGHTKDVYVPPPGFIVYVVP